MKRCASYGSYMKRHRYKHQANTHWHQELVRVISTNDERNAATDDEWDSLLKTEFTGGIPLVQAYVLKQMTVSARGKYADLRYNKYSPDFDESECQQDEKYWKYLNPILLDLRSSALRTFGLNSLYHFEEAESVTSLSLHTIAVRMENYMNDILMNRFIVPWSHLPLHDLVLYHDDKDKCRCHPQFINVDIPVCTNGPTYCECLTYRDRRRLSSKATSIIVELRELFTRVRKLARHLAVYSLQRMMPNLPMDVILTIWHKYLACTLKVVDIFEDVTQKEMFIDLHHHITAIEARLTRVILGRPTQNNQHFYHDSGMYEHFHALLCCRISKFARVKFHSLPKCMREGCDMMGENHRLLTLRDNMKIAKKCVNLYYTRQTTTTFKDRIVQDRRIARVMTANKKRIVRAEKRINDIRCWINYPINITKLTHFGMMEAANQIQRFSTYCDTSYHMD